MGKRRRSREIALQVLFQIEMIKVGPEEALELFYSLTEADEDKEVPAPPSVRPFAEELVQGVWAHKPELDELITSASEHWRLERMSLVDRNILRLALFEILHRSDIPPKVSINEAIDLGKSFGSSDSGAFINGILDHILNRLQQEGRITDASEE